MSEEARSCHRTAVVIALFAFKAEKARQGRLEKARFERPLTASHLQDIGASRGIPLWLRLPLIKADRLASVIADCSDATLT